MVLANIKQSWKANCLDDHKMQLAYQHLRCMSPETKPALGRIYHKVTTLFESLLQLKHMDDFLPSVCCGVRHTIATTRTDLTKVCSRRARADSAEYLVNLMYSPMADAVDLVCSGYQTLADCEIKAPRVNAMIVKVLKDVKTYNHTVIVPMVHLLARLDQELSID